MGICAFCKEDRKLTKEHVTPSFIYRLLKENGSHQGWNSRIENYKKNFENVIKDVCACCNNGVLSSLDSYGKRFLLKNNLLTQTYIDDFYISYEFDSLARWLLKICFNSARIGPDRSIEFEQYINFMLHGSDRPNFKYFGIAVEAAKPHKYEKDECYSEIEHFKIKDSVYSNPFMFRMYRTASLDPNGLKSRCLGFGGVYFHLIFVESSQKIGHAAASRRKYIKNIDGLTFLEPDRKQCKIRISNKSWLELLNTPEIRGRVEAY